MTKTEAVCRAFLVAALFLPSAARAQAPVKAADKVAPALKALLTPKHGAKICFTRIYDPAHLQAHPQQKVRALWFLINVEHLKDDNLYRYEFTMRANIRGVRKTQETSGECGYAYADTPSQERTIRCGVECDGGGVSIEQERDGNLLVHLANVGEALGKYGEGGRIRMAACGETDEDKTIDVEPGADDKSFRLRRAPAKECKRAGR
jgi:hypothetical protein